MKQYPEKLFGTDGIRGTANDEVIAPEVMVRVARLAGHLAKQKNIYQNHRHRYQVVIAKDTRLSGYMLEPALTSGFVSVGMDVLLVGPIPTPGLAMLTQSMRADLGVMISASHNLYQDNGIKIFGGDGYKIDKAMEQQIESMMNDGSVNPKVESRHLGRAKRIEDAMGRYIEFVKGGLPKEENLEGLKVVVDCAHGAAYRIAPLVLQELGAEVVAIGIDPDGTNINQQCGSLHPESLTQRVKDEKADIGIGLDGDADRLILVDEKGNSINGDKVLAIIVHHWHKMEKLTGGVVGTEMSNLGLETFIKGLGVEFVRVAVGDKNIIEKIRNGHQGKGFVIGAEPSGHVVMKDFGTTGDGLMAALQVLYAMKKQKKSLSALGQLYQGMAEKTINLTLKSGVVGKTMLEENKVKELITTAHEKITADSGLLLVRPSGTEKSILRVTVQLPLAEKIDRVLANLCDDLADYILPPASAKTKVAQ